MKNYSPVRWILVVSLLAFAFCVHAAVDVITLVTHTNGALIAPANFFTANSAAINAIVTGGGGGSTAYLAAGNVSITIVTNGTSNWTIIINTNTISTTNFAIVQALLAAKNATNAFPAPSAIVTNNQSIFQGGIINSTNGFNGVLFGTAAGLSDTNTLLVTRYTPTPVAAIFTNNNQGLYFWTNPAFANTSEWITNRGGTWIYFTQQSPNPQATNLAGTLIGFYKAIPSVNYIAVNGFGSLSLAGGVTASITNGLVSMNDLKAATNNFPPANLGAGIAAINISGSSARSGSATNGPDGNPLLTYANTAFSPFGPGTNAYLITNSPVVWLNGIVRFCPNLSVPAREVFPSTETYATLVYTNTATNGLPVYLVFNETNLFEGVFQTPIWTIQTNYPDTNFTAFYVNLNNHTADGSDPRPSFVNGVYYPQIYLDRPDGGGDNSVTVEVWGQAAKSTPDSIEATLSGKFYGGAVGTFSGDANGTFSGVTTGTAHLDELAVSGAVSLGSLAVSNIYAPYYFGNLLMASNAPPALWSSNSAPLIVPDGDSIALDTNINWSTNFYLMNQAGHVFKNTNYYNFAVNGQNLASLTNRYWTASPLSPHSLFTNTTAPKFYFPIAFANDLGATPTNVWISEFSNLLVWARADGAKIYVTTQWTNSWINGATWTNFGMVENAWLLSHSNLYDGIVRGDLLFSSTNQSLLQGGPHPTSGMFYNTTNCGAVQLALLYNAIVTPTMTAWSPPANSLTPGATMNGVIVATTNDVRNATNNLPSGAFYTTNTYDLAGTATAVMLANAPGYQTSANVNALILNATNSFGTAARQSTSAFDAAGVGAAAALNATNNLGSSAFKNTNTFDLAGTGVAAATAATNGLAKTNAPILLNPLIVYPTNNLATMNVIDLSKAYSGYTTNAGFVWGLPINVNASAVNVSAVFVTNSSGSLIAMTPAASWGSHTNGGAWNVTNVTVVQLTTYGVMWTNAISWPLW